MADEGKKPVESHLNVTASERMVIEKTEEDGATRNKPNVWVAKGVRRRHVFPKKLLQAPETTSVPLWGSQVASRITELHIQKMYIDLKLRNKETSGQGALGSWEKMQERTWTHARSVNGTNTESGGSFVGKVFWAHKLLQSKLYISLW